MSDPAGAAGDGWTVVVPVKPLALAKTRLSGPPGVRARLAAAMALDTVDAILAAQLVADLIVVTDEERLPLPRGAHVIPDRPASGLSPALEHGALAARRRRPGAAVAALAADLPALTAAELDAALNRASQAHRAVVGDADGVGTVLLTAASGPLCARFGPDSLARHLALAGALDLTADAGPGLRRDVDTGADLRAAVLLGVGPRTSDAVTSWPLDAADDPVHLDV